jgi:hypothetical protein
MWFKQEFLGNLLPNESWIQVLSFRIHCVCVCVCVCVCDSLLVFTGFVLFPQMFSDVVSIDDWYN